MASIITHALVGVVLGKAVYTDRMPRRFWILAAACPVLPDLDVIGFSFGIEYGDFFGHRGFSHSLFFALLVSVGVLLLFFRQHRPLSRSWWGMLAFFFAITASHGLLDALTDGGLGIALLSPFDQTRYFFPWTPIAVAPIGVSAFFSSWGLAVMASEMIWIWLPLGLCFCALRGLRYVGARRQLNGTENRSGW